MHRTWPPAQPQNLVELAQYLVTWADCIYLRREVDGRWQAVALAELPQPELAEAAQAFIDSGIIPVIVRPDDCPEK